MRIEIKVLFCAAIAALLGVTAALAADGPATGDTSKKRIGLTDGFSSNSWEQSAWNAWKEVAGKAVKDGVIGDQKIITGNDDPAQQITQLQNLVLEGYDAIVVDSASPTALNGAINLAQIADAGIELGGIAGFNEVRNRDGRQQADNGDDNHDFHQRKPSFGRCYKLHN